MKKFLAILLTLVLVAGIFSACGGEKTDSSTNGNDTADTATPVKKDLSEIHVGVSIGHTQEERWQREVEMFENYAKEKGFKLSVQSAENSPQKQVSQCENLINQGIDVLIMQSIDADAVTPIVDMAHENGIKVVAYDRFAMNCDLDYYITFDSFKVGVTQANFVVNKVSKGNFIWLKGAPDDNNAHLVAEGQASVLQPLIDSGDINVVLEQWCLNWDPKEALQHTENALTSANNDVQAVVASNDGTAGGAIQALLAQGLTVPISGQDADLAACQRIVEGTQTGTVYKPLAKLNQACIELAVAIATGEDDVKGAITSDLGEWTTLNNTFKDVDSFSVDVVAIDKDNLYDILIAQDNFQTLEDVYKNVPKDQWPA